MGLTAISIQNALVAAVSSSAAIAAACLSYFGVPHRVISGGSGRHGANEEPSFAVVSWSRSAGEDDPERAIELSILLSISDSSITAVTDTITISTNWVKSTSYNIGDIVLNDTDKVYLCIDAGTSAGSGGPTGTDPSIADNTVVWQYLWPDPTIDVEVETYGGPAKLEYLLALAAAEVVNLSTEIMITDLNYSFEPLEFYPLFVGGLDFIVTVPVLIGGYEPTLS